MSLKRLIVSLCIVFICSITFIGGYTRSAGIAYADSTTDAWTQVTTNEQLVEAFRYYCKSRDLTIEGSVADAVTSFSTKAFNGICNTLGIDVTALQAQIKYQTDGNLGNRFLFSAFGIDAYNRIFAQFLQDNNLSVGDTVNDVTVADGPLYKGQFCYVFNRANTGETPSKYGTAIGGYVGVDYWNIYNSGNSSITIPVFDSTRTYSLIKDGNTIYFRNTEWPNSALYYQGRTYDGRFAYVIFTNSSQRNNIYLCNVSYQGGYGYYAYTIEYVTKESAQDYYPSTTVFITTNNTTINNNTYEGDTIINNNGTPSEPSEPDDPDDPNYNPYPDGGGGTTPPTNTGGGSGEDDGTITFPDFDFHLPEINWSLGDLSQKFPFSIPFDLIAFFTVLNAEPEAPAIDADIPLGTWYTWHFEADFSQFDNYAVIIRNVEFIGFCVGLIYLTVKLVKG